MAVADGGVVLKSYEKTGFFWEIPDFLPMVDSNDEIRGPEFLFAGCTYRLCLSASYWREFKGLRILIRMECPYVGNKRVYCSVGVWNSKGYAEKIKTNTFTFQKSVRAIAVDLDCGPTTLDARGPELLPSGTLMISCNMENNSSKLPVGLISQSSQTLDQRCVNRISQSSQTSELNDSRLQEMLPRSPEFCGTGRLLRDLEDLLLNGNDSDAIVRVKEQDIRVHRAILGARAPVFFAMFRHDTSERASGIVHIEDCESDVFHRFLLYVYTGRVNDLTAENATEVYEVANKYQVDELKKACIDCIKSHLSVESFCHAVTLALKYEERELIKLVTDFFVGHMREILRTVEWQAFLSENPIQGNELLIKSLGDA